MLAGLLLALLAGGPLPACSPGPPPVLQLVPPIAETDVPPALHRFLPRLTAEFWQGATAIEMQQRHPCLAIAGGGRFSSAEVSRDADLLLTGSFRLESGRSIAARRLSFHPRRNDRVTLRPRGMLVYTFELRDAASGELFGRSRYSLAWVDAPRDDERLVPDAAEMEVDNLFYGEWSPDPVEGRLPDLGLDDAAARLRLRRTPVAATVEPLPPAGRGPIRLVGLHDAAGEPLADGTPLLVEEIGADGEARETVLPVEGGAITLPRRDVACGNVAIGRRIDTDESARADAGPDRRKEVGAPVRGDADPVRREEVDPPARGDAGTKQREEAGAPVRGGAGPERRIVVGPSAAGSGRTLELHLPLVDCFPRRVELRVRLVSRRDGGGVTEQEALFVFALGREIEREPAGRGRVFERYTVDRAWLMPVRFELREPLADAPGCERRLNGWPGPLRPERDGSGARLTLLRNRRSGEIAELRLPAWNALVRWNGGDSCAPGPTGSSTASLLPSLPPGALGRGCLRPERAAADGVSGGCRWQAAAAGGSREGSVEWSVRLAPSAQRANAGNPR